MRMLKLSCASALCVHLFSCFFFLAAKLSDLDKTTWVYRKNLDYDLNVG